MDFELRYRAMEAREDRYAGEFFAAVTSTGIYCRRGCPARTPKRENVRFYLTAAAARSDGFRACLRCHPDEA
jgi:AraC family transcriptional regulator of adaptative response / DNA-3-methyladenine glycosylase II